MGANCYTKLSLSYQKRLHGDVLRENCRTFPVKRRNEFSKLSLNGGRLSVEVKRKRIDDDSVFGVTLIRTKYIKMYETNDTLPGGNGAYMKSTFKLLHNPSFNSPIIAIPPTADETITAYDYKQTMQASAASMATLCNIGNTCYLNSVVYTLRFAPKFLHNLHHLIDCWTEIKQRINQNNGKTSSLGRKGVSLPTPNGRSLSTKDLVAFGTTVPPSAGTGFDMTKLNPQLATEKLHEVYQHLYRNELLERAEPFHAGTLLTAIQGVSSVFEGNQQQDAHEFLMCILDSIRETCQAITKIVADNPDLVTNGTTVENQPIVPRTTPPPVPTQPQTAPLKALFFRKPRKRKDGKTNKSKLSDEIEAIDSNLQKLSGLPAGQQMAVDDVAGTVTTTTTTATPLDDNYAYANGNVADIIKKLGLDFFAEDFEGVTVSATKCLSCETVTEQKETMIDLSVPITENDEKIDRPQSHLFIQNLCVTREHFRGDNKYRCEQCFGYTEAIRTISYPVLPRLLVIQLKRFSGGMEKINSYIPTPFDVQCFCSKCCELPDHEKLHVYNLYSVITHVGATLSVGHYIAYTCSPDMLNEYMNCSKDSSKLSTLNQMKLSASNTNAYPVFKSASGPEKNSSFVKKMMFGRGKASSSGDVTKNLKNIIAPNKNGTNGNGGDANTTDKPIDTTCTSLRCCALHFKSPHPDGLSHNGYGSVMTNGISVQNHSRNNSQSSNCGSISDHQSITSGRKMNDQPIWYMCDDDKIKAITKQEFEDMLSPSKKMVTPYLLFYARSDVQ